MTIAEQIRTHPINKMHKLFEYTVFRKAEDMWKKNKGKLTKARCCEIVFEAELKEAQELDELMRRMSRLSNNPDTNLKIVC